MAVNKPFCDQRRPSGSMKLSLSSGLGSWISFDRQSWMKFFLVEFSSSGLCNIWSDKSEKYCRAFLSNSEKPSAHKIRNRLKGRNTATKKVSWKGHVPYVIKTSWCVEDFQHKLRTLDIVLLLCSLSTRRYEQCSSELYMYMYVGSGIPTCVLFYIMIVCQWQIINKTGGRIQRWAGSLQWIFWL